MRENLEISDNRSSAEPTGYFRRLWREQKCVIVTSGLVMVAIIIAGVAIAISKNVHSTDNPSSSNMTLTNYSTFYARNSRNDVQPCSDFYIFACSRLIDKYEQEKDSNFDTMKSLRKVLTQSFETLLSPVIIESESVAMKKMKGFYKMCMNQSKVEIEGKEALLELLRKVGGWPLLNQAGRLNKTKSWQEIVGQLNRVGFESLFPFRLEYETDPKDPTKLALVLETFVDVRYYALSDTDPIIDSLVLLAESLGSDNPNLFDDVSECVLFKRKLFEITQSSQTADPVIYSVSELSITNPGILSLVDYVFASMDMNLSSHDTVILKNPKYSKRMIDLLENKNVDAIHNYLVWKILEEVLEFANIEPRGANVSFVVQNMISSRSQACIRVLLEKAPLAMGLVYKDYSFDPLVKAEVGIIFQYIKNQAFVYLNESTWIDNVSKANIFTRLRSVKAIIGYQDGDLNSEYLQNLSRNWQFHPNDRTLENYRNLRAFHQRTHLKKLRMSQDEEEIISSLEYSIGTGAVYFSSIHTIQISAGLMQEPYFSLRQPKYLNYGGIGLVIAHELTHSLDILLECENRTCPSYYEFQKRKGCAQKVYNNYTISRVNQKVNGTRTLDENIGDLLGLQIAYRAYNDWIKGHGASESALPYLNYTTQQLFWINAAITHCSYQNDTALISTMANDEHSTPEARVNVGFSNSDDFAHDFMCPVDSKMNPRKKCRL